MGEAKGFEHRLTLLENLPNEVFMEIFVYLSSVDLVYAFVQQNMRFLTLINYCMDSVDFKSVSKMKFDCVGRYHNMHQWRMLRLSEDEQSPGQIRHFCQRYPLDQYFPQLQSLSAVNMPVSYAGEFVLQLVSFDHLDSLEIGNICGESIPHSFRLSSLRRLVVTACQHNSWMLVST